MKLIPEIREAWRYSSVRISAAITILSGYWLAQPKEDQIALLTSLGLEPAHLPVAICILVTLARVTAFRKDGQ